jgi:hypothetical protein
MPRDALAHPLSPPPTPRQLRLKISKEQKRRSTGLEAVGQLPERTIQCVRYRSTTVCSTAVQGRLHFFFSLPTVGHWLERCVRTAGLYMDLQHPLTRPPKGRFKASKVHMFCRYSIPVLYKGICKLLGGNSGQDRGGVREAGLVALFCSPFKPSKAGARGLWASFSPRRMISGVGFAGVDPFPLVLQQHKGLDLT